MENILKQALSNIQKWGKAFNIGNPETKILSPLVRFGIGNVPRAGIEAKKREEFFKMDMAKRQTQPFRPQQVKYPESLANAAPESQRVSFEILSQGIEDIAAGKKFILPKNNRASLKQPAEPFFPLDGSEAVPLPGLDDSGVPLPTPGGVGKNRSFPEFPEPPRSIGKIIEDVFGPLADKAKVIAFSENGSFNPNIDSPPNDNGSIDRGIMQINSDTFDDYMRRMSGLLNKNEIYSFDDMFDARKNIVMGSIIYKYQGWGAWNGPKRLGIDLE